MPRGGPKPAYLDPPRSSGTGFCPSVAVRDESPPSRRRGHHGRGRERDVRGRAGRWRGDIRARGRAPAFDPGSTSIYVRIRPQRTVASIPKAMRGAQAVSGGEMISKLPRSQVKINPPLKRDEFPRAKPRLRNML